MSRMLGLVWSAVCVAAAAHPGRAAGPCPADMRGGCRGFVKGKHLALDAVLGTGLDASAIKAVAVTPDGKIGYGLRGDGALDAWDLRTGALGRVEIARFIALDPRGRWAVASKPRKDAPDRDWAARGSALELWDLAARRRVASAKVEWSEPIEFTFSKRVFVSGYMGGSEELWVWDTATGKIRRPEICPGPIAVTPDGNRALCTGGDDDGDRGGGVVVMDLDRMKVAQRAPKALSQGGSRVAGLALSPDGRRALVVYTFGEDHPMRSTLVWNLASGRVETGPETDYGDVAAVRWSPDGRMAIVIGDERYPGIVLGAKGRAARDTIYLGHGHDGATDAVFLPDGKSILEGDGHGVMRLLTAADTRELRASRVFTRHTGGVAHLSVSRDGTRLLSHAADGSLKLWDLQANRLLRSIAVDQSGSEAGLMTPDGAFAVAGLRGLSVIRLSDGTPRTTLNAERSGSLRAISPDGTLVFAGSTLWEIPSGREVWSLTNWGLDAAAFSADGRRLYAATRDRGLVWVIDTASGVTRATLGKRGTYTQGASLALAVAPREDFVLLSPGGYDPDIKIRGEHSVVTRLDLPSGGLAWKIPVRNYVMGLAVSPDGHWFLAVGSMHSAGDQNDLMKDFPGQVELRATADGAVADALDLQSADLVASAAVFTPDGRTLLVGTDMGTILRFAVTP